MFFNSINKQDIKNYLSVFEDKRDENKRKRRIDYDKFLFLLEETNHPQTCLDKSVGELDEDNISFTFSFSTFSDLIRIISPVVNGYGPVGEYTLFLLLKKSTNHQNDRLLIFQHCTLNLSFFFFYNSSVSFIFLPLGFTYKILIYLNCLLFVEFTGSLTLVDCLVDLHMPTRRCFA